MAVRCSAKQIADFVTLWGMTGAFPEFCEHAEDTRDMKSLDLIISTLDIFVDAFCFSFEDIYRKYKVNFPLSEEKFIEFLKPRCLLLTKDNKCFNFMLVCAFVYEIVHSFSHYNKCFHLVKVASKCLAAILNYRFKKIFETDSDWEELMSFCIRIHGLVYPPEKTNESDGNQLVEAVTDKMDASFSNMTQGLAEMSVGKYAIDDNNDNSNTKTPDKNFNILNTDLTAESEGQELEDLCNSKSTFIPDAPHPLQLPDGSFSLKSENMLENDAQKDNVKVYVTDPSLPNLAEEFTDIVSEKTAIKDDVDNENLDPMKKNVTLSFKDYLAIRKVIEKLEDLCNLGLSATDSPHTLQLKVKDSSLNEAKNETIFDGNGTRKDNEKYCMTDIADSSLSDLAIEFADIVGKKMSISNSKEVTETFDRIIGFKKSFTLSFVDYSAIKKVIERLEDLCTTGLSVTGTSYSLQLKVEDYSSKETEDKEKMFNEKKNAEKDCARCSSEDTPERNEGQEISKIAIYNKNGGSEKPDPLIGFEKHSTLSLELEKINLCNLEPASSTNASHTFQMEGEDFSPNAESEGNEKVIDESNTWKGNESITDSLVPDLDHEFTKISIEKRAINKNFKGTETLGQMRGYKKNLTLPFDKDSSIQSGASTDASHTFQMEGEDLSPNAELEGNEKVIDESNTWKGNESVTDSLVPDLDHEFTKISVEKRAINKNFKGTEKLGQRKGCKKNLTLSFDKDSSIQSGATKLERLCNWESVSSIDRPHTLQLKDEEFSSKKESEDKEPFNIRCMSADKVRARITDSPQHLSEIMNLLKKCEDIEANFFSPDEYNIPINDSEEDEASSGTLESPRHSDQNIFESSMKTIIFEQNMKMAYSIKGIFLNDIESDDKSSSKASGGGPPHEMSDEVAYVYGNRILESKDPHCSLCDAGMSNFFDACVNNFATKYSNNNQVTDLLRYDFHDDSD